MSRKPRTISKTGIYHVMARGVNKCVIFYDDEDYECFLGLLKNVVDKFSCDIIAWSLMSNHIHLQLRAKDSPLAELMKFLLQSYSTFFNKKYDRVGPLFQDRYKSKPIETVSYFLAVLKYIHRNPLEIGNAVNFWTSYDCYTMSKGIANTELALNLLHSNKDIARKLFVRYIDSASNSSDDVVTIDCNRRLSDREAADIICCISRITHPHALTRCDLDTLESRLQRIRSKGVSIRQLAKLTGVSKALIEKLS